MKQVSSENDAITYDSFLHRSLWDRESRDCDVCLLETINNQYGHHYQLATLVEWVWPPEPARQEEASN